MGQFFFNFRVGKSAIKESDITDCCLFVNKTHNQSFKKSNRSSILHPGSKYLHPYTRWACIIWSSYKLSLKWDIIIKLQSAAHTCFSPNSLFVPLRSAQVLHAQPQGQGRKLEDYSNKNLSAEFITNHKFGSGPLLLGTQTWAASIKLQASSWKIFQSW